MMILKMGLMIKNPGPSTLRSPLRKDSNTVILAFH
jgi:hypothetical protein